MPEVKALLIMLNKKKKAANRQPFSNFNIKY